MASFDDLLKTLPIDEIAESLGVKPAEAAKAVTESSAVILGGLEQNAQTPEGAAALEKALEKHGAAEIPTSLGAVDVEDGQKILKHVFGSQESEVAAKLGAQPATQGLNFSKLLPLLAPVVMAFLARGAKTQKTESSGGGLDLGSLIGSMLGGGSGGLGSILGGLFGGR